MPELPEVETLVRALRPSLEGRRIGKVIVQDRRVLETSPTAFRRRLCGRRIERIDRRGKWIILEFDNGQAVLIQLRMTGQVRLVKPGPTDYVRLRLVLDDGTPVWYCDTRCLGRVALLNQELLAERLSDAHQGPDALAITSAQLGRRLQRTSRNIKSALLDQRLVAGIGNIYADESLHAARLHPETIASTLSAAEIRRLHRHIGRILRAAIEQGGSTLRDGRYQTAIGGVGGFQIHHRVYGREGKPCRRCTTPIVRKRIRGLINRSSYFCPNCQPKAS